MENTVFVRFEPTPQHKVMRHELEDIFSQAGPIKKSSWINTKGAIAPSGDGENYQRGTTGRSSKGYGFIKYLAQEDALAAQKTLNNSRIQMDGKNYMIKVELASVSAATNSKAAKANYRGDKKKDEKSSTDTAAPNDEEAKVLSKKKSRIIVRNLSFYAKENHIRKAMESNFGKVLEVHVPKVKNNLHVGFCFVTFEDPKDAQKAVEKKHVNIQKRAVNMDWSLPKKLHQQKKQQEQEQKNLERQKKDEQKDENDDLNSSKTNGSDESNSESDGDGDGDRSSGSGNGSESVSDSDSDSDGDHSEGNDNDSDAMDEENGDSKDDDSDEQDLEDESVGKKCCLFLRNLPFDSTRHDLFQLLYKFGHIKGIYLVKDRETGMLKGTAFVTYSKPQGARRAMEFAASSSSLKGGGTPFLSQRQKVGESNGLDDDESQIRGSLVLKGRKILVDMAVDKETASTFESKEYKIPHADRRNLYLQAEARVESTSPDPMANKTDTWDDLPQQDQKKRQTALKDKIAKLQSPIFFINPNRLSFRNMGKHVDEGGLQKLIELATKRGLEKSLVRVEDQIAHWRALGEMSTREILAKIQEIEGKSLSVIPSWNYDDDVKIESSSDDKKKQRRKNIKDFIPSVYIDRDFGPSGKKVDAPSRGFGFAEFTHHTHALACLRELNNNSVYSKDYAAGGKAADTLKKRPQRKNKKGGNSGPGVSPRDYRDVDGRVRVPRLIVDFVVENKVKAKKQAERRMHQQLNQSKQRLEKLEKRKAKEGAADSEEAAAAKKKGRGAIQREKKRKKRESGEEETERQRKLQKKAMYEAKKELRKERAEEKKRKAQELKRKSTKPPKKKKSEQKKIEDDEEFENIVRTYQSKLESAKTPKANPREVVKEKRWFE